jgi:ornithine cyclodeaminase
MEPIMVLSADEVRQVFSPELAFASQFAAFRGLGRGEAVLPARVLMPGVEGAEAFCYAARATKAGAAVSKFGSVNPGNTRRDLPSVNAVITVLDPDTGVPLALLDGSSVTELRTAAASAVAAAALAHEDSTKLAIIGTGVQGMAHARAVARALPVREVAIFSRGASHCAAVADKLAAEIGVKVLAASSAREAVEGADVVVTCTTSATPVVEATWVAQGALVISIGSFAASRAEVPRELLSRASLVVVDHLSTALEHAGPIIDAVGSGVVKKESVVELGDVLCGRVGRRSPEEVIFYNSVGVGVQDAAAAEVFCAAARSASLGRRISL